MIIHSSRALGDSVRRRRLDLNLSQSELAEQVGVSRKWIIDVEHGKPTVAVGHVLRLFDALDIDVDIAVRERPATHDRGARPETTTVDLDDLLRAYKR